jgi:hypothetical protein
VLRLYGDKSVSDKAMVAWANRLFARNLWLDIWTENDRFLTSRGFWLPVIFSNLRQTLLCRLEYRTFAERDASECSTPQLAHVMLKLQEKDGSWWDYPLYSVTHQPYGTAFALMTLVRLPNPRSIAVVSGEDGLLMSSGPAVAAGGCNSVQGLCIMVYTG